MKWNELTMRQRSDLMRVFLSSGISSLSQMRRMYEEGGAVQGPELVWKNPEQKNQNILRKFIRPDIQIPYTETYWKNINSEPVDYDEIAERQRFMESAYNNRAVSNKGARGAWGIMPSSKKEYIQLGKGRPGNLNDPRYNRKVRDYMMRRVMRSDAFYPEDTDSVRVGKQLAYYNWGMGNMRNYLKQQEKKGVDTRYSFDWLDELPEETRNYVNFILRNKDINEHKNQEEYERLRDRYYSKHRYLSGGHLYDGSTEKDQYLHTLDEYVKRNPVGIWENTPEASSVRKYLYKNAPDRMSFYYFSLPEETRESINPKFIPDSIRVENIKRKKDNTTEKISRVIESIADFIPVIGDIKGLVYDPIKAYKEGGISKALSTLLLGTIGVLPGGDALKVMKKVSLEEAAEYVKKLKEAGIDMNISTEKAAEILNNRIEKINNEIKDKLIKNERVSISGNRGIYRQDELDTYNKEGNIGWIQVKETDDKRYNGVVKINNISEETTGHHIPGQTVYGLDAARQFSNSKGKSLISGEYLLMPEKTLRGHQHLFYRELSEQGKLESTNLRDYISRFHPTPSRKSIIHDLSDPETIENLTPSDYNWATNSYPEFFSDLPIERAGKTTYLKNPEDSWMLEYMDDRPGWYQREILGIKEPDKYPHTVYSRFPDVRAFYEKNIMPLDDLPSFADFGIFKFNKGGILKKKFAK